MHRVANAITEAVSIPLLHIADATAEEVKARGHQEPCESRERARC